MGVTTRAKSVAKGAGAPTSTAKTASSTVLNPVTRTKEFMGVPGAILILFLTHFSCLLFHLNCGPKGCPHPAFYTGGTFPIVLPRWDELLSLDATIVYLGWLGLIALLWLVLPGKWEKGTVLRTGERLDYKENGWATFITVTLGMIGVYAQIGAAPFIFIYTHAAHLTTTACLFAVVLGIVLYVASFRPGALLATGGNSGNAIYDFFIGRELNPRIGLLDIKQVVELRPGIIGWWVMNISALVYQYESLGGRVSNSMLLVQVFQGWYIADSLWNEHAVLTTMDITTDGFGWMLSFGNLAWVPFCYGLQARYLAEADRAVDLSLPAVLGICALQFTGYYIFRSANSEKDSFRRDPDGPEVKHLKYLKTEAGSRLLISGWWGMSRHVNYLGDWLMSIAWCLPCGFASWLPYFYVGYFATLLLHRERRDEHKCRLKYGKDWEKYCEIVPYRIIPGVY